MKNMTRPSILLISVDALRADIIMKPAAGVYLDNITELFIKNGTYASNGMKSVFLAYTYLCHKKLVAICQGECILFCQCSISYFNGGGYRY